MPFGVTKDKAATRLQWAKSEAAAAGYPPDVAAWVVGCAAKAGYGPSALQPMLLAAFNALPHVEALLMASPPEALERLEIFSPALAGNHVAKLAKMPRFALYAAPRATVAPRLRIRRAKVEDHDDLLPVLVRLAPHTPHSTPYGLCKT